MKNRLIVVPCLFLLISFGSEANAATTEGTATATIMTAISTSKNIETSTFGDLAFGVIVPSESSGTVTISSTSDRTHDGGVELVASISGAASFNISGASNTPYTVTLPGTDTIKISSGSNTMQIHNFTVSSTSGSLQIGSDGKSTFNVGGKLEVGENQPEGNYTGTFEVTVAYQ
jgi:hypothetical protein